MTLRDDLHIPRADRRAQRKFRHKAWRRFRTVAYLQGYDELCREWAPRLAAALLGGSS